MFEEKQMKTKPNNSFVSRILLFAWARALSSVLGSAGYLAPQRKPKAASTFIKHPARSLVALLVVALLSFSNLAVFAHPGPRPPFAPRQEAQDAPKVPSDQLDSLVAPIALYPDPLLSQTLVAST